MGKKTFFEHLFLAVYEKESIQLLLCHEEMCDS